MIENDKKSHILLKTMDPEKTDFYYRITPVANNPPFNIQASVHSMMTWNAYSINQYCSLVKLTIDWKRILIKNVKDCSNGVSPMPDCKKQRYCSVELMLTDENRNSEYDRMAINPPVYVPPQLTATELGLLQTRLLNKVQALKDAETAELPGSLNKVTLETKPMDDLDLDLEVEGITSVIEHSSDEEPDQPSHIVWELKDRKDILLVLNGNKHKKHPIHISCKSSFGPISFLLTDGTDMKNSERSFSMVASEAIPWFQDNPYGSLAHEVTCSRVVNIPSGNQYIHIKISGTFIYVTVTVLDAIGDFVVYTFEINTGISDMVIDVLSIPFNCFLDVMASVKWPCLMKDRFIPTLYPFIGVEDVSEKINLNKKFIPYFRFVDTIRYGFDFGMGYIFRLCVDTLFWNKDKVLMIISNKKYREMLLAGSKVQFVYKYRNDKCMIYCPATTHNSHCDETCRIVGVGSENRLLGAIDRNVFPLGPTGC